MKTKLLVLLSLLFIAGCQGKTSPKELTLLIPRGATSITHAKLIDTNKQFGSKTTYEIIDGTDPLVAAFASNSHSIIVAPTNLGIQMIEKGANYKIASIITNGNLYVACNSGYDTDRIVAFGENAVPGLLLEYLMPKAKIEYLPSLQDVQTAFLAKKENCVLLAEPGLTAVQNKIENGAELEIIDIQELWESKTNSKSGYPQAAIFINENANKKIVNEYLAQLKIDIESNEDFDFTAIDESILAVPGKIINQAYPKLGIVFIDADTFKIEIDEFIRLFGLTPTNDTYYYKK